MNQLSTKIVGAIFLGVFALPSLAQNWQVGGNTNPQLGGNQPIMGTIGNNPLQFITNGTQRLYIDNSNGGVLGNVGIGSMFNTAFRPASNLHIHQDNNIFQFSSLRNWMSPSPLARI